MAHARSQIIEHIVNSNAETTDARLTATLARFYCDDLRIIHCQTVHTQTCSVKPVPEPTSLFSVFSQPEGRSVINHLSRRSPATAGRKRINSVKERGSHGALRFLATWTKSLRPQLSTMRYQLPTLRQLLLHQFDSLFDYLVGETVDGDVYPVMFFAFHDEIVLETGSIWFVVAGLGD